MIINKAFKVRIYPNDKQRKLIDRTFGCVRAVYNIMLAERKKSYEDAKRESVANPEKYNQICDELSKLYKSNESDKKQKISAKKKELRNFEKDNLNKEELKKKLLDARKKYKTPKIIKEEAVDKETGEKYMDEVDAMALSCAVQSLNNAFNNFFQSLSGNRRGASGYPKFKKKTTAASYQTYRQKLNWDKIVNKETSTIFIPKAGNVKFHGKIPNLQGLVEYKKSWQETISRDSAGHYFISVLLDFEIEPAEKREISDDSKVIGLDMSLGKCYVDSDGNSPEYNSRYRDNEKKIARLGKLMSKKVGAKKGDAKSRRFVKLQKSLARKHFHITQQRREFVELETNKLIKNNDFIGIETLNMRAMGNKKGRHGKSVSDVSWGLFTNRLAQKIEHTEKTLHKVDRNFPSSQLCPHCHARHGKWGKYDKDYKSWICKKCGAKIEDRDINAARNIREETERHLRGELAHSVLFNRNKSS